MADKFPELDDVPEVEASGDFLSREKEILGDEFATAEDSAAVLAGEEDEEFEDFKTQFPEVGDHEASEAANTAADEEEYEGPVESNETNTTTAKFANLNLDESEHIQAWKERRDLEISKRDEVAQSKGEEIKNKAKQDIDDFYDNYNSKKDDSITATRKEEKEFIEKRDSFLEKGTVWDRVSELLKLSKNSNSVDLENHRDKTRFKELLLSLKGKEDVPGAAGY